ncbi:MAG TPA: CAP domain-containing protein [Trichocoleus sp.]|jgi:uncharacterized protein YkwD
MRRNKLHSKFYSRSLPWIASTTILLTLSSCGFVNEILQEYSLSPGQSSQPEPMPSQSPSTATMETQVIDQINQIRLQKGLSELRFNEKLTVVARRYSKEMAEKNFFSHNSPQGDTVVERVRAEGVYYIMVGENLFRGTNLPQPVSIAVSGWMNSPGHRANILRSEYRETGVGVWRIGNTYYMTQLFLRSMTL